MRVACHSLTPTGWRLLAALVALGFALRVAMASGGMWLDEAWSAVFAQRVGTVAGVFLGLNHDNNHHLNSLWMQAVGMGAPSLVQRALSVLTGTLAIGVAGLIGARRGSAPALVTALAFAVSPVFVTYGAEARGYAPMTLAFLIAVLLVDRWLAGETPPPRRALGWCFGIGMLCQATILFGLCAILGWVALERRRRPLTAMVHEIADVLGPAIIAALAALAMILWAPIVAGDALQVGGFEYFSWARYGEALRQLAAHLVAAPQDAWWPLIAVPPAVLAAWRVGVARPGFHAMAILAFPLAIGLVQPANPANARYYLIAGVALVLMLGEMLGKALARGGAWRLGGALGLAVLAGANLWLDGVLIADQRGRPDGPIAILAERSPGGAALLVERKGSRAIYQVAAAQHRYPVHIMFNGCAPAGYLVANRFRGQPFPDLRRHCGARWRPIGQARGHGLADDGWQLYERVG